MWSWIPGTLLGVAVGLWGGLAGTLAPKGRARNLILGSMLAFLALSAVLLLASIVAFSSKQPYGVWYGLGLPGVLGLFVIGLNFPGIRAVYRRAEFQKMSAKDLEP
jgi:hypothetical protein